MKSIRSDRTTRFEALVAEVYEPVQRYALRRCASDAANDVVADTLLAMWRRLDEIPADAALPWAYRTAANCLANSRRSSARRERLLEKLQSLPAPAIEKEESDPVLHAALERLAAADQEILRLWAWEHLATSEIAVVLDITANAASIRLHRAKRRLADELNPEKVAAAGKDGARAGHSPREEEREVT